MGLVWAVAWSGAGVLVALGFLLTTGVRADAPFPLLFGFFGFVAGVLFSGLLGLAEGRRRFEQMSLRRFAAWGAIGGFALATTFVGAVALGGDLAFLGNLLALGPLFAAAGAGSAAGSLALARRARDRARLEPADSGAAELTHGDG